MPYPGMNNAGLILRQEIIDEIKNRYILHWNFRSFNDLPVELYYRGRQVEELYLKWNNLSTLPVWIDKLKYLKCIHLFGNEITHLPQSLGNVTQLMVLEMQNNYLEYLPNTIGSLKNLSILNLQFNKLEHLPPEIKDLKGLAFLNLRGNKIMHLPPSLCSLESLQELILDNNVLTSLPLDIIYAPKLMFISLNGNNLRFMPFERFINNPSISLINNSFINYLSYNMGSMLANQNDSIIHGNLWIFDFKGCATDGIKEEIDNVLIEIKSMNMIIAMPNMLRVISSENDFKPSSLFELCMRTMHDICFKITDARRCLYPNVVDKLPRLIKDTLYEGPVSKCHKCHVSIFHECILWLFPRCVLNFEVHNPSTVVSCVLFCSPRCVKDYKICGYIEDTGDVKFSLLPWEVYSYENKMK